MRRKCFTPKFIALLALVASFSTVDAFAGTEIIQSLTNTGVLSLGKSKAKYRARDNGTEDFNVELEDVTMGGYELLVDGIFKGNIVAANENDGEIESRKPLEPGKEDLDFAPGGNRTDLRQGGVVSFSHVFPTENGNAGQDRGDSDDDDGGNAGQRKLRI